MRELINIMKDIKTRALPVSEIPGFLFWAIGKRIWLLALAILAAALYYRDKR